jgi:hypothetical protein
MVVIAYMVDKDYCGKGSVQDAGLEMGKCIYKKSLKTTSIIESNISGALDPSAIKVKFATVPFHVFISTSVYPVSDSASGTCMVFVLLVMASKFNFNGTGI